MNRPASLSARCKDPAPVRTIVTVEIEVDRDDLSRNDMWQPEAWNFDSIRHADSLGLIYGYEFTGIREEPCS